MAPIMSSKSKASLGCTLLSFIIATLSFSKITGAKQHLGNYGAQQDLGNYGAQQDLGNYGAQQDLGNYGGNSRYRRPLLLQFTDCTAPQVRNCSKACHVNAYCCHRGQHARPRCSPPGGLPLNPSFYKCDYQCLVPPTHITLLPHIAPPTPSFTASHLMTSPSPPSPVGRHPPRPSLPSCTTTQSQQCSAFCSPNTYCCHHSNQSTSDCSSVGGLPLDSAIFFCDYQCLLPPAPPPPPQPSPSGPLQACDAVQYSSCTEYCPPGSYCCHHNGESVPSCSSVGGAPLLYSANFTCDFQCLLPPAPPPSPVSPILACTTAQISTCSQYCPPGSYCCNHTDQATPSCSSVGGQPLQYSSTFSCDFQCLLPSALSPPPRHAPPASPPSPDAVQGMLPIPPPVPQPPLNAVYTVPPAPPLVPPPMKIVSGFPSPVSNFSVQSVPIPSSPTPGSSKSAIPPPPFSSSANQEGQSIIPPIVISGKFLYNNATMQQFSCRGIAFSPDTLNETTNSQDFFLDSEQASWGPYLDILANLSVNCLRLYQVCNVNDPGSEVPCGSHQLFMNAMAALGIYVIVPVVSGGTFYANTLRADLPAGTNATANECYGSYRGQTLFRSAAARVSEFAQYSNTLAFAVGNELILNGYYPAVAGPALPGVVTGIFSYPCAKALSKDLKVYMQENGLRAVPTLYAMQNPSMGTDPVVQTILHQASYMACSATNSLTDGVDIIGINVYNWCHVADTFVTSGYQSILQQFINSNMNTPFIFSEYGCNTQDFASPYPWTSNYRTWVQVPCLFSPSQMASYFSGGVAYTLVMAAGQKNAADSASSFGLVATAAGGNTAPGQPPYYELPSYFNLQSQYLTVSMTQPGKPLIGAPIRAAPSVCPTLTDADMLTWFEAYKLSNGSAKTGPDPTTGQPYWNSTYAQAATYLQLGTTPPSQILV